MKHKTNLRTYGFSLVEIMIVVGIIALILAIALPTWMQQRRLAQGRACSENLSKINGAKEQYALENNLGVGGVVAETDLWDTTNTGLIKQEPECPSGGIYTIGGIGFNPTCTKADAANFLHVVEKTD